MRRPRFSIATLMGVVVVAAVGLAAWRNASEGWAGLMVLVTCGTLALAVVGAIYCRGAERAWWLGFAIFGWGYLALLKFCSDALLTLHPISLLLEFFGDWLAPPPRGLGMCMIGGGSSGFILPDCWFAIVVQCLWTLLIAPTGGVLARLFFARSRDDSDAPAPEAPTTRSRWLRPTMIGLAVPIGIAAVATIRAGANAPIVAGLTHLLTCVFVGLTILGAILGRSRRAAWLGAALFGAGYMAMVFTRSAGEPSRAYLATDSLLKALRPRLSPVDPKVEANYARVLEMLERPIPMPFPNETPLDDVLKYIQQATTTPDHPGLAIYVDPIGLLDAGHEMSATVRLDLEGVPLRETLRLILKQLGLAYEVREGYLRITSEYEELSPHLDDPFVVVGHCLMAMLASAIGAIAGPIVAGRRAVPVAAG